MKYSDRLNKIPPYLFVEISKKIAAKRAVGQEVISFGIGDPDLPTPQHIIDALCAAAQKTENHRYPETDGTKHSRQAVADWYEKRFGVKLDEQTEVLPLIGSKEGIGHIAMCFIDADDIALVPDPGYPVYSMGTILAGGKPYYYPLKEENGFLPNFDEIPEEVCQKAKVLWINYPNNPTGAVADLDFFEKAVAFAKKYDLALFNDAPYTEIAFDGYKPVSLMQVEGAKDVAVEFHSVSKTYNMCGWRFGMVVGNAQIIKALATIKSNLDSGVPGAIQEMAITALEGPQDYLEELRGIYQRRRDRVCAVLDQIGIEAIPPKASLYVWAKVPKGYTSASAATDILEQTGVVVTPGSSYGPNGEGYIRLSMTISEENLERGLSKLVKWQGNIGSVDIRSS